MPLRVVRCGPGDCVVAARPAFAAKIVIAVLSAAGIAALAAAAEPGSAPAVRQKVFRAGAYAIDVSPPRLPVIVNGSFSERTADKIVDPLHARCLVLDDGSTRIAIAVVDSCMMPRALLDEAKRIASAATGIRPERMLISATHTHSAPSVFACLGSDVDEAYARFLPGQIAKGIALASERLVPARVGWGVGRDERNVACRRWRMKPGTAPTNPFGGTKDDQAMMHPGNNNPNAIEPTGPVDPEVPVLSIQTLEGAPLAILSAYSLHYVGAPAVSADYFGEFCEKVGSLVAAGTPIGGEAKSDRPPFMAALANGTSGDAWLMDYSQPRRMYDRFGVAGDVARAAFEAYKNIHHEPWVSLAMEERLLTLGVRMPGDEEVAAAREFMKTYEGRKPKSIPEVYARETVLLGEMPPTRELKLQAVRIGKLGIAAIPNEVFGSTGLAIKAKSPLKPTFTIELANGCEGYIPPPEQHKLGGYTTWRARSSCLEVAAEPKITAAVLELLAKVAEPPAKEKGATQGADDSPPGPLGPADALRSMRLREELEIELVAAEPDVVDPVAFDWGPDGKLWVAEMRDYPLGVPGGDRPGGRIRCLEDRDNDGRFEHSTLFAEGLAFPNGVMAWRQGVLVTAAPHVLYLEDSDGDGRADIRKPLFSGFNETNQQWRVNGLRWGLDNWVYCAGGTSGGLRGWDGRVRSEKTGRVIDLGARDVRIRPDTGDIDPQAGTSQFGRTQDDWGNWFGCNNNSPMWHYALADHYMRRNPHFAPPEGRVHVSEIPKPGPVYAISPKGDFFHASEVGRFTSANSAMVYRDVFLGEAFAGNAFISEPVHNLVHREIMERRGVTFTSRRAADEANREFLASADPWFRPTMIRTGPDGALWIADMYRRIIEHPEWIPKETQAAVDLRAGDDRGRLWRVYPRGRRPAPVPRLDRLAPREVAGLLESTSGTLRDMAQQEIVTRGLSDAVPRLKELAAGSPKAAARVQALGALDGLNALEPDELVAAMSDEHPGVRRQAVRLAEGRFAQSPALGSAVDRCTTDPDPAVRQQAAFTLGEDRKRPNAAALAGMLRRDGGDPYIVAAVMSSVSKDNVSSVVEAFGVHGAFGSSPEATAQLAAVAAGYDEWPAAEQVLLKTIAHDDPSTWASQWRTAAAILDEFEKRGLKDTPGGKRVLAPNSEVRNRLAMSWNNARLVLTRPATLNAKALEALRAPAVLLLGRAADPRPADIHLLASLLVPSESMEVQSAAIAALARRADGDAPRLLLAGWKSHSPTTRAQVLDKLLERSSWTAALLDAMERGEVLPADVDAARRQRLLANKDAAQRARSQEIFQTTADADRAAVLDRYRSAATLRGDVQRGAAPFAKKCAACHGRDTQPDGAPRETIGADLAGLTDKSPAALLVAILDPNRAVEPRYLGYTVVLRDGRTLSGMLVEETGTSIALVDLEGKRQTVLRTEIETLRSTGKSFMPEGLEQDLSPQDLADVMAFVAAGMKAEGADSK